MTLARPADGRTAPRWGVSPPAARLLVAAACVVGVGAILASSSFSNGWLAIYGYATPLPIDYPLPAAALFLGTGLLLGLAVLARPAWFYPLLVATAVVTGGMSLLGGTYFDEWLVGAIVAAGLVCAVTRSLPRRREAVPKAWKLLFIAFCLYFAAEALAGYFLYDNVKALRFLAIFGVVLVAGILVARYDFPLPSSRSLTRLVAWSSSAYFALYIAHGFAFPPPWISAMDGIGGASSAYATITVVVAAPAALLLLRFERGRGKWLGWLTLGLASAVAVLSDSRAAIGTLAVFAAVALWAFGPGRALKLAAVASGVLIGLGALAFSNPWQGFLGLRDIVQGISTSGGSVEVEYAGATRRFSAGDFSRVNHIVAAFNTLRAQPEKLVFGAGTYGFWPVVGPEVRRRAEENVGYSQVFYGSSLLGSPQEPPRPSAIAAWLAESGLLGLGLLGALAAVALRTCLFQTGRHGQGVVLRARSMAVAGLAVPVVLAWGFSAPLQDVVFFYLLLAPFGLLHGWTTEWWSWYGQKAPGTKDVAPGAGSAPPGDLARPATD